MLKFNYKSKNPSKTPTNQTVKNKKRSTSQIKYLKAPDIMTQAKPSYLNNFVQPINPHQSAFTPTSKSKNLDQNNLLLPQKSQEYANKKTLILDLDETLVHSSFIPFDENDIILNVDFESAVYNIYVLVRPGAIEFLKKVSKYFEVIIFTASIAKYALPLLNILDQEKKIKYRLTREHCTFLNGIYIKELKKLNRNLKDLIIVDNSPLAYAFDNDNGLPIKTWYEDQKDNELEKIFPLLEFLSKTKDVRTYIKQIVINNEILYEKAKELINKFNKNKKDNNTQKRTSNNNINILKDNKDDNERKAISVNININIKNKSKFNESNYINIKDSNDINNNKEIQNINKKGDKENNKTSNNIINKYINNLSYNINHTTKNNNYINNKINSKNINNGIIRKKNSEIARKQNVLNQNKKNSFRTGQKIGEKLPLKNNSNINNIHLDNIQNKTNNNFYINNSRYPINNNNEKYFSFGFSLSNTTKNKISKKAQIQYNNNIEKKIINNTSKNKDRQLIQKNLFNDKDNSLNNNYKFKYTTLLEKIENKIIKSNYSLNNKSQTIRKPSNLFKDKNNLQKNKYKNFYDNDNKKINHIRASSSLIEKYNALIINNSTTDNKLNNNNTQVSRSKSTGHFITFTRNNHQKPKTPKNQIIFEKKTKICSNPEIDKNNKKCKNLKNEFSKTTRNSNKKPFV